EKGNTVQSVFSHEYEDQVTWYGVSFDKGFVIISADDAVRAILGYSFDGKLVDPEVRDGGFAFKEWFGYYDKQIKVARKYSYVDAAAQTEWKNIQKNSFPKASKGIMVDALVRSHWDQVWPWNDLCPDKSTGTWTYVGCVATAASMIMRYHEWPPTGTGSNSYSWDGQTLSETFSNYTFDYTVMKHDVEIEYGLYPEYWESVNMDAAAIQNMAELNYLVGQSFDMSYGDTDDGGSGANMSTASTAMNNYWYYTSTLSSVGTPTDPTYIASTIQAELNAKRPWWWAGGVHSFILDGYTDDYWYHFNWGWGGFEDGWYQITSLIPGGVGSGGGDGDYTASQIRISLVPDTNPFTAWPAPNSLNGTLANGEDVQLTWSAPTGGNQDSYNVFKSINGSRAVLLTNTTGTSYNDNDLISGSYSYYVTAVYSDGESHNTNSYSVDVTPVGDFAVIRNIDANAIGRTNIDLSWDAPFTGLTYVNEDFETSSYSNWIQYQSNDPGVKPPARDFWYPNTDGWGLNSEAEYVHSGLYSTGLSYLAGTTDNHLYSWNFSPQVTLSSGSFLNFWMWFKNKDVEGWFTHFRVYLYASDANDFVETTAAEAAAKLTQVYEIDGTVTGEAGNNLFDSEVQIDLSAYAGTYRIGLCYIYTDGYQFYIDDLLCGTNSGGTPPDEYDIYRNGTFATTVSYTGASEVWSDTGFIDGDNTYFVRAIYPTGQSLRSQSITQYMTANPKPDYLTGVLNGTDIDLAWYLPYGTPPHWATYIAPENCTTTVDNLVDEDCAQRRVVFLAEDLGLFYPVYIDSIAAGFYEWDDDLWGTDNTFTIRLWDGNPVDGTLLYESGILTATPNEIYKVGLPMTYELNGEWNVEVETYDLTLGHPSNLAGPSSDGTVHSYFYKRSEDAYSYSISSGDDKLEYCMLSYVTGADPNPIVKVAKPGEKLDEPVVVHKEGWTSTMIIPENMTMVDNRDRRIPVQMPKAKGIDTYNVYRDGVMIGTTTSLTYTDAPSSEGTYNYEIKAAYVNPVGLSEASNSVDVYTPGGGIAIPAVPANIVTSISGADLIIDWDVSADATGYDVYSSDDPYGTFTLEASVGTNQYTVAADQAKLFYYIVATN
ncbi:MAG: C10 family peptidase, partial [Clostridia bacterium]|nr:C10 family peptidase [Clostridia bacterium]